MFRQLFDSKKIKGINYEIVFIANMIIKIHKLNIIYVLSLYIDKK